MFDPSEFLERSSEEIADTLRTLSITRDELVILAGHLKISVKTSATKPEIQKLIIASLLKEKILTPEEYGDLLEQENTKQEERLPVKMDREYELEILRLRDRAAEREHTERLEKLRLEEKERERNFELEKLRLQQSISKSTSSKSFDVIKNFQAVPTFQEEDVDMYFLHFEKLATSLNWPKQHWTILLQKAFVGKAREIFSQLSVEQSQDYDYVKDVILCAYQLNPEAYRQKFRSSQKANNQTYVEFARKKEQLFDRWCHSKNVKQDFGKLRQIILIEEFKRRVPVNVKTYLDEKEVETLKEAADFADAYDLTHSSNSQPINVQTSTTSGSFSAQPASSSSQSNSGESGPFCNYCKRRGHLMSDCFKLANRQSSENPQPSPSGHIVPVGLVSDITPATLLRRETSSDPTASIMGMFEPFIQNGFVSLSDDLSQAKPIRILRDTGSAQSILRENILPFSNSTYLGSKVLLKGVDALSGSYPSAPLHRVFLSSDHVSGPVTVGIQASLPVEGIDLLLGNDLAGSKVFLNALDTDKPTVPEISKSNNKKKHKGAQARQRKQ